MDLLLHNLRTIGTHHCDGTVGEEAADEIERLRAALATLRSTLQTARIEMAAQDVLFELWGMVDLALTPT